jgi:T3SS negative regulator,GrlR
MVNIDGFWTVNFDSNSGNLGSGVVVIHQGRVFGGDSGFMYTGNVKVEESIVHVDIDVSRHTNFPTQSIFGQMSNFHLKVSGSPNSDTFTLTGHLVENLALTITIIGVRRAELAMVA